MTFTDSVLNLTDANGQISWVFACGIASMHGLSPEFWAEYGHMTGERVDAGELLVWLGY
jgi:hypothetical protein